MPNNPSELTARVYYALHIRREDGHHTEYNRHGVLPKMGELISVILRGEPINVRVLNVISQRTKELAELVHNVYSVEV